MTPAGRFWLVLRAILSLGVTPLANYTWYQFGMRSGLTERVSYTALLRALKGAKGVQFQPVFQLPSPQLLISVMGDQVQDLLQEAEEVCAGKTRLFGFQLFDLDYRQGKSELWFTRVERSLVDKKEGPVDMKFFWEPARFGWVYPLGRAYRIRPEERYVEKFWEGFESFSEHHPPYYGVNWLSAQEVALRLMALTFGFQVFQNAAASTAERKQSLLEALAVHAARIPCTLSYAVAQNNNHLLSEAVGLMTAGAVLRGHSLSDTWWKTGWKWFLLGICRQIAEDGTYVQHSANYHRLMLQLALWARLLAVGKGVEFPNPVSHRLTEAAKWLWECCEVSNGRVPNLGPNDGAIIQPLSQTPFHDYRAVIQAAWRAFVGKAAFPQGVWDEMSLWYGVWHLPIPADKAAFEEEQIPPEKEPLSIRPNSWVLIRSQKQKTWAAFRCPRFFSRPAHADLLHVDLWWDGVNLAMDAGTYRYTAPPPWENSLAEAFYHNTVTVDGRNPMTRAGKFLWLDWAKTRIELNRNDKIKSDLVVGAEHTGYLARGVRYQRWVTLQEDHLWIINDCLEPAHPEKQPIAPMVRLHWLVTLGDWQVTKEAFGWGILLRLHDRQLRLWLKAPGTSHLRIVKAGKVVFGEGGVMPVYGYFSPSYNHLEPALSVILEVQATLPLNLETVWDLTATDKL
jgi:hypothetical protein